MSIQINPEIFQHVLSESELNVNYQPIVSISKRSMIGFESLLRAYYYGEYLSPDLLFDYAVTRNSVKALDKICQKTALQRYQDYTHNQLLFINLETSLIEYYLENSNFIMKSIDNLDIPRGKIVIEINEKRADNNSRLLELITVYRAGGFLIALDDVGAGHSNLNRIVLAKPDIIKIDRSVIMNIDQNYYKQEVLRSITDLGQKIGAITLAEGTETENEVITCVECGVDWFQGYFFSKAVDPALVKDLSFKEKCQYISEKYQKCTITKMKSLSDIIKQRKEIFNLLITLVTSNFPDCPQNLISDFMLEFEGLECVYIIDGNGMQITETIFHPESSFRISEIFSPMQKGDYHISKSFFNYAIHNKEKTYVSVKYISFATGNYCQTLSKNIFFSENQELVLCADFKMD